MTTSVSTEHGTAQVSLAVVAEPGALAITLEIYITRPLTRWQRLSLFADRLIGRRRGKRYFETLQVQLPRESAQALAIALYKGASVLAPPVPGPREGSRPS